MPRIKYCEVANLKMRFWRKMLAIFNPRNILCAQKYTLSVFLLPALMRRYFSTSIDKGQKNSEKKQKHRNFLKIGVIRTAVKNCFERPTLFLPWFWNYLLLPPPRCLAICRNIYLWIYLRFFENFFRRRVHTFFL